MSDKKKLFVCEFITAGGLVGEEIPDSLVKEGSLMRNQLCHELSEKNQYDLISMHDARLRPAPNVTQSLSVNANFESAFAECLSQADYVWLIAPEFEDILLRLTQQCETANVPVIGADSSVVRLASDKLATASFLTSAKINTPLTLSVSDWLAQAQSFDQAQAWLAKPIKGVGGEGILSFGCKQSVLAWLSGQTQVQLSGYFLQERVQDAQAASISILCHGGDAHVLSCNQLHVEHKDADVILEQIIVNGFAEHWSCFTNVASEIAKALPIMRGYLGVDVMFSPQSGEVSVIELNPRLSSSYVGLGQATGQNIAQCLLDAFFQDDFQPPNLTKQQVTLTLN